MAGVGLHQRRCRHDDEIFEDLVAMLNVSFAICLLFVGQFSLIVETERPEFALPPEAIHNISGMNSAPPDCNAVGGERKMINFQCKGGRYRSFEIYIYILCLVQTSAARYAAFGSLAADERFGVITAAGGHIARGSLVFTSRSFDEGGCYRLISLLLLQLCR